MGSSKILNVGKGQKQVTRDAFRKSKTVRRIMFLAVLIVAIGFIWTGIFVWKMNTAGSTVPLQRADVGIVLGASMWGDKPSPGLKERLEEALRLYHSGKVKYLIVSGGLDQPTYRWTEAEGMQQYLVHHGIEKQYILLENKATSTYENLLYSKQIMRDHGWSTAIIVTHTYHGPRALEIAQFLDYTNPQLSLTSSQVLSKALHQSREILAYGKWTVQRLLMIIGE